MEVVALEDEDVDEDFDVLLRIVDWEVELEEERAVVVELVPLPVELDELLTVAEVRPLLGAETVAMEDEVEKEVLLAPLDEVSALEMNCDWTTTAMTAAATTTPTKVTARTALDFTSTLARPPEY